MHLADTSTVHQMVMQDVADRARVAKRVSYIKQDETMTLNQALFVPVGQFGSMLHMCHLEEISLNDRPCYELQLELSISGLVNQGD